MAKITYDDKVALNEEPSVAEINKVTDDNMNEIKSSVNTAYDLMNGVGSMGSVIAENISSKNMLNSKGGFTNNYISSTGVVTFGNNNALFNQYIQVKPNTKYIYSGNASITNMSISEYDDNYSFIQRVHQITTDKINITTSGITKYLRLSINFDNVTTVTQAIINSLNLQFEEGDTRTTYTEYFGDLVDLQNKTIGLSSMGNVKGESFKSKNLFNKYAVLLNKYIDNNSTAEALATSANAKTTEWMPCLPNTNYTISGTNINRGRMQFKNKSGTITFYTAGDSPTVPITITTGNDTVQFRIYFYTGSSTNYDDIQIEKGDVVTPYTNYIQESRDIYSATETQIGYWYDGSPLYRAIKAIPTTNISSSSTTAVDMGINYNIVNFSGYIYFATSQVRYPIGGYRGLDFGVRKIAGGTQVVVGTSLAAEVSFNGYIIFEYTKA